MESYIDLIAIRREHVYVVLKLRVFSLQEKGSNLSIITCYYVEAYLFNYAVIC
jgi:hypothetical protein